MKKGTKFHVGDKVFAKVKGYPAWPAIVSIQFGINTCQFVLAIFFF